MAEIRAVQSTDGSLTFIGAGDSRGQGVVFSLSWQQLRILYLLDKNDRLKNDAISATLYALPVERWKRRKGNKMTDSQRAALSRSLKRLSIRGLITQPNKQENGLVSSVELTPDGRGLLEWIKGKFGPSWEDYQRQLKESNDWFKTLTRL